MRRDQLQYVQRVSHAIEVLRGREKVAILCAMRQEPVRLGQLKRLLSSASEKRIIDSLEALLSDGIIVRRVANHGSIEVEYDFSEFLKEALPALLDHLYYWHEFYEIVRPPAVEQTQPGHRAKRPVRSATNTHERRVATRAPAPSTKSH